MQKLSEIIGQERIKQFFRSSVRTGKIPHALMLIGDEGSGKYSIAKAYAMNILCENVAAGKSEDACLSCHTCKQILAKAHPDLIEVVHEKENTISVENIRTQVNATASIRPYQAGKKIYIIDEAKKMNTAAQNALLKTLEEPPDYVSIFLLTDNEEAMLETIKSRCIKLRTAPVSLDAVRSYLQNFGNVMLKHTALRQGGLGKMVMDRADLERRSPSHAIAANADVKEKGGIAQMDDAAQYSDGFIGRALDFIHDERKQEQYKKDLESLSALPFLHVDELQALAQEINKSHKDMEEFFTMVRRWYKDILIYKNGEAYGKIEFKRYENAIQKIAQSMSLLQINQIFQSLDVAESRLRANVNTDLTIQMFLMECLVKA